MNKTGTCERQCLVCGKTFTFMSRAVNGGGYCIKHFKMINKLGKTRLQAFSNHNIDLLNYIELYKAQNGKCKLCNYKPGFYAKGNDGFHIDHDHNCCNSQYRLDNCGKKSCGKCIRALLCHGCNVMIGRYEVCKGDLTIPEFDKYLAEPHFIFSR